MKQGCHSSDASIHVSDVFSLQVILEMVVSHLHFLVIASEMNRECGIRNRDKEE